MTTPDQYVESLRRLNPIVYIKGKRVESVPAASYQGVWYSMISIHGGGSPEAGRMEIMRKYDLEERKSLVEKITGIKS